MESRRNEDYKKVSQPSKLRNRHKLETDHDSFLNPRPPKQVLEQSPQNLQRSVSPRGKVEGSRRVLGKEKTGSTSAKDHSWCLDESQTEKVQSGSPRDLQEQGRLHVDDDADQKRHGYVRDMNDGFKCYKTSNAYGHMYHGANSRMGKEDYRENSIRSFDGHEIRGQKRVPTDDEMRGGAYGLHHKLAPASCFGDTDAQVASPSDTVGLSFQHERPHHQKSIELEKLNRVESVEHEKLRFRESVEHEKAYYRAPVEHDKLRYLEPLEHGKIRYRERTELGKLMYQELTGHEELQYQAASQRERLHHRGTLEHEELRYLKHMPSNKVRLMEIHDEREKPIPHARDVIYTNRLPASFCKDFGHANPFEGLPCTSSGALKSKFSSSCKEGISLPGSYDYPRSNVEFTEFSDCTSFDHRQFLDPRDLEARKRSMTSYPRGSFKSSRFQRDDYSDPVLQGHMGYDNVTPSDCVSREMKHPYSRLYDEHVCTDHEHREFFRSSVMHPVRDRIDHDERSSGGTSLGSVWMHPSMKEGAVENLDTSGIQQTSKWDGEHLGSDHSQIEFGMRESWDNPAPNSVVTEDCQYYGFGRDAGPRFEKHRLQSMSIDERRRVAIKRQRMEEELTLYKPSDTVLERKHSIEEDIDQHNTRTSLAQEWNLCHDFEVPFDTYEEWIDGDASASQSHMHQRFDSINYSKARTYHGADQPKDSASADWFTSQDSLLYAHKNSVRNYKSGAFMVKDHSKSGALGWHNPTQTRKRSAVHGQQEIDERCNYYVENVHEDDDGPLDGQTSEPSEDSEEFKQLVDVAFLMYSKKLNLNAGLQRRYREQGKAGSLFCIVCGRRSSKEFLDTQRLVTHAFMSRKVGLRAKHMGLHKAICVLMGWNTFVPCDIITWVPEVLPDLDAWAQKEDLILWPPVVIVHNISMCNNNPEHQKVVPIDWVASFLRGKGFVQVKMKVSLGKPADQSVILLKFVDTFTGIADAEKISEYFCENGRGRKEFGQKTSTGSKSTHESEAGIQGDKTNEQLLYGYLGIADDMDRLDYNTKQWISIRSKKEIVDLANAPVKTDDK